MKHDPDAGYIMMIRYRERDNKRGGLLSVIEIWNYEKYEACGCSCYSRMGHMNYISNCRSFGNLIFILSFSIQVHSGGNQISGLTSVLKVLRDCFPGAGSLALALQTWDFISYCN